MRFQNRADAGRRLAVKLRDYAGRGDVIVLALPRGGVPVGVEVARELVTPLDVFLVRKLGVPGREELAMGAIASGGARVLNQDVVSELSIPDKWIDAVAARETEELARREAAYRGGRRASDVRGKVVIVVDDGLATGASMRAAMTALRSMEPKRIVVAVPVGAAETCRELQDLADAVVCAMIPEPFMAVGSWYWDFNQTTDEEVQELLAKQSTRIDEDVHPADTFGSPPRSYSLNR